MIAKVLQRHGANVLAVPLGAGIAFLCLEVIGMLFFAVALPVVYATREAWRDLPIFTAAFGFGFTASVGFIAIRISDIFQAGAGSGTAAWFGFWFLVGLVLFVAGSVTCLSRRGAVAS